MLSKLGRRADDTPADGRENGRTGRRSGMLIMGDKKQEGRSHMIDLHERRCQRYDCPDM